MSSARSAYRPSQNMSSRMRGTSTLTDRALVIGSTSVSPWSGSTGEALTTHTSLLAVARSPLGVAASTLASPPTSGRYAEP